MDQFKLFFGARVIKTSIAAGLAVYLASYLHFPGYTYAALVAVLATQKSLARSFGLAKYQIASALIGTFTGNTAAFLFGPQPWMGAILVYLMFVIHLRIGWRDTILMAVVTGLNSFFTFQGEIAVHGMKQILIVLIGIGCSILVNLVAVPRYEEKLEELLARVEGALRGLIYLMHHNLSHLDQRLSKDEFNRQVQDVRAYIQEAKHYAELIFEDKWIYNQQGRQARKAIITLQQMELLATHIWHLNKALDRVEIWVEPIPRIQRFMDVLLKVQSRVFSGRRFPVRSIDYAIIELDRLFSEMELPKNRLEFITRSALFHFYEALKEYYEDLKQIPRDMKSQVLAD